MIASKRLCIMDEHSRGMSLLELLIVVAIIGIIMVFALPSYRDYTVRAHRVDAKTMLMRIAAAQEKFYLVNSEYCANADMDEAMPDGLGIDHYSNEGYYNVTIDDAAFDSAVGYSIVATAVGDQLDDDAGCKVLSINHMGVRFGGPSNGGTDDPRCWGK
ncbi:MAG: prepilin-type N-terminal cleavage/methylation domain-containing protein [Gammaproteobacteria bacterium]|nr:prepilin-type N-terminal cleavage/methylation domain-containing protein [Gammaproteobacteria bacterium]MCP4091101.1 prepilin-type N-terminal cleavage/methylation domain-containing protein [Gammaproteobacteria bacterium]MCP4277373.1 prepilin-type N-terminal cleavage/methylation domain-containing protein [Gammaproteobacteria bacterium]MCP4831566.1 prepilin-type N-terminal cleavage/methylation domain-containing protein [Gammaproteobacteria bacterium]MCP4927789.1 prepilin-type N-terminal cleavag